MRKEDILQSFLKYIDSCSNGEGEFDRFIEEAFNIEEALKNSDE
ncbi:MULTISPECIES: hypothetical protein [Bacillus]|nr:MULTISPECIES: hypothetical protein [Bacillus]MCX2467313.1 hypothetical protein [Bacillus sp. AM01]